MNSNRARHRFTLHFLFTGLVLSACAGGPAGDSGGPPDAGPREGGAPHDDGVQPAAPATGPKAPTGQAPDDAGGDVEGVAPVTSDPPPAKGALLSAQAFGDPTAAGTINSVTLAADGGVLVTGSFTGAKADGLLLGTAPKGGTFHLAPSTTSIIRLAPAVFGSFDRQGDIVVAFSYSKSASVGSTQLPSATDWNTTIVKLDTSGRVAASSTFAAHPSSWRSPLAGMALTPAGHVVLTGSFEGAMTFPTTPAETHLSAGLEDIFVLELDSSLAYVNGATFGGMGRDSAAGIAVDSTGNLLLAGNSTEGGVAFAPNSHAGKGAFVASLGPNLKTSNYTASYEALSVSALALDGEGHAVLAGSFGAGATFGGAGAALHGSGVYVLSVDDRGLPRWKRSYEVRASGQPQPPFLFEFATASSLAVDTWGDVVLAGSVAGEVDFGGTAGAVVGRPGASEQYVVKLSSAGTAQWVAKYASAAGEQAARLAVDRAGHIFYASAVEGLTTFASADGTGGKTLGPAQGAMGAPPTRQGVLLELSP
jgi:hypothetical protein